MRIDPWTKIASAGLALACACAGRPLERDPPPEAPPLRLLAPPVVRWETTGGREVTLAVENPTFRRIRLAALAGARATVRVFPGPADTPSCRQEASREEARAGSAIALEPGERRAFTVALDDACGALDPGEYRLEVGYFSPPVVGEEEAWTGTLPDQHATVVVRSPEGVAFPADRNAIAPPPPAAPDPLSPPALPPGRQVPDLDSANPATDVAACVDDQLARRGLNAFGDPAGMVYDDGPPAPEGERIRYVLRRHPDLATACAAAGPLR